VWAVTAANSKRIMLDPDPDPKGNQAAYRDHTGTLRTRQLGDGDEPQGYERRYMPHIATCTGPGQQKAPQAPAPLPDNVIPISRPRRR
jgi:hypothetical protein